MSQGRVIDLSAFAVPCFAKKYRNIRCPEKVSEIFESPTKKKREEDLKKESKVNQSPKKNNRKVSFQIPEKQKEDPLRTPVDEVKI